jgi:hypothetical protein
VLVHLFDDSRAGGIGLGEFGIASEAAGAIEAADAAKEGRGEIIRLVESAGIGRNDWLRH